VRGGGGDYTAGGRQGRGGGGRFGARDGNGRHVRQQNGQMVERGMPNLNADDAASWPDISLKAILRPNTQEHAPSTRNGNDNDSAKNDGPPLQQDLVTSQLASLVEREPKASVATGRPSKKRKPTLKTLNLSDVMPANLLEDSCRNTFTKSKQQHSTYSVSNIYNATDFPSLSAVSEAPPFESQPQLKTGPVSIMKKPSQSTASNTLITNAKPLQEETSSMKMAAIKSTKTQLRDETGDEHAFLRLIQEKNIVVTSKGRQRIRPRKKKFTSLKKKILQERLEQWRSMHPESEQSASDAPINGNTVCVFHFVDSEEIVDDDEYEEFVSDLHDMAMRVGEVKYIFIPRDSVQWANEQHPCFVAFEEPNSAAAATACWNGLIVAGDRLKTSVKAVPLEVERDWQELCLLNPWVNETDSAAGEPDLVEIALENVLTLDDLEDGDCLEETIADISGIAEQYGFVEGIHTETSPVPRLMLKFKANDNCIKKALEHFNMTVLSGSTISATLIGCHGINNTHCVIIQNVLTDDDLEDEDCLQESIDDTRELAGRFGMVVDIEMVPSHGERALRIAYASASDISAAIDGMNGMQIGGTVLSVFPETGDGAKNVAAAESATPSKDGGPMFSGDKRIPERFAECKRVPKVPGSGLPRHYATLSNDPAVKEMLSEMLSELMRLQKRATEEKNAKAKRRLVMGFREVARGIRSHKVKMVIAANNLDEYGAIDEKLQEILDLCRDESVPTFFEFNKRALGKAIDKSIKIAVVGVQNAEGAHQHFKKLTTLAPTAHR
jgi:selenocysteine insertion sequence-binding protein 2